MKATKKIWKGIAGKLKNRKGSQVTTNSEGSAIEEPRTTPEDVEDDSLEVKGTTSIIETDI
ncbi:hypothetical protein [Wolbachia endosymbiont (group A) of Cheilosia soror]|uniref:hypothetical protein n=1 Tax=Wolbachia endosymbiont (group A) of Cheilosia soror TaxID=2953995 RepID=UPI0021F9096C|nr:hypothetical protein [Wolbachia endosymbiont (group A) of Cheilosia soror]